MVPSCVVDVQLETRLDEGNVECFHQNEWHYCQCFKREKLSEHHKCLLGKGLFAMTRESVFEDESLFALLVSQGLLWWLRCCHKEDESRYLKNWGEIENYFAIIEVEISGKSHGCEQSCYKGAIELCESNHLLSNQLRSVLWTIEELACIFKLCTSLLESEISRETFLDPY